ncbi:MAG: class I SAM-dependent methyltransferase [Chloroflexi bacterium]|nr:class I SAM-dependent methyltransferase [Chloroflexota bacterium]
MKSDLEAFKKFEHKAWNTIADRYEDAWGRLTRLFIPHLLDAVKVEEGNLLLDVASGPGFVAQAATKLGAVPVGVDFSAEMVRIARDRNPGIEFHEGDAQALEFEDNHFDIVVMNFAALHLSDPAAAFAEARRVLRRGGRYGFTVWAGPDQSPAAKIVEDALSAHADLSVALPKGPDYFGYGDPDMTRTNLGELGFKSETFQFHTATVEWTVPSAAYLYEIERDAGVRTAAVLAKQEPEVLRAIQNQIENAVQEFRTSAGFALPYAAHIIAIEV